VEDLRASRMSKDKRAHNKWLNPNGATNSLRAVYTNKWKVLLLLGGCFAAARESEAALLIYARVRRLINKHAIAALRGVLAEGVVRQGARSSSVGRVPPGMPWRPAADAHYASRAHHKSPTRTRPRPPRTPVRCFFECF
jgi:uncharacterized protein (DUF2461 family)